MAGSGRILRIEGSAGVGKSHLVAAFLKDVATLGIASAAAICQSTERDTAYHAVRQITRALFKIDEQMSGSAVIERIEESVRNSNPSLLLRLPLLGEIIGIEIADNPTTASLDAKLRQEALQSLAVELLQAGARRRLSYLEQLSANLYHRLKCDDVWPCVAALADELLAHETLDEEQIEEIMATWLGTG